MTDKTEPTELLTTCPLCGGRITRVEITDEGGTRRFSLCCDAPLEAIDNWDVFSGLDETYQKMAIARIAAEYAAMDSRSKENARQFKIGRDKWLKSNPELFHGGREIEVVPMHDD